MSKNLPNWARDAGMYELYMRSFTPEGTIQAASDQLPRLRALGVKVLWIMPIQPIGKKNRKGTTPTSPGSPYSIRDYVAVDPALGTLDDFRHFVTRAHALGIRVILDWVANHTAWDHVWTQSHPEFFTKNAQGNLMTPAGTDWDDVIDLDYTQPGLHKAMIDAMSFWLRETQIDGFRCDVAGMVPIDFWIDARTQLTKICPELFMLAEAHEPIMHIAFDATYAWQFKSLLEPIIKAKKSPQAIWDYMDEQEYRYYLPSDVRLTFLTNHDENSWNGTDQKRFGAGLDASLAFSLSFFGMPLIYNGQEAGLDQSLPLFEREPIPWHDHPRAKLIARLLQLKSRTPAMHNAEFGARPTRIPCPVEKILAFSRAKKNSEIIALFNFSPQPQTLYPAPDDAGKIVSLTTSPPTNTTPTQLPLPGTRKYRDVMSAADHIFSPTKALELPAWGWHIFEFVGLTPETPDPVEFTYDNSTAERVFIVDECHDWWEGRSEMKRAPSGIWHGTQSFPPGHWQYKFAVNGHREDAQWIFDPKNPPVIPDGDQNSIIAVGNPPSPRRLLAIQPLPADQLPEPILDAHPDWLDLWWAAWDMAWPKIKSGTTANGFVPRYMDEGFNDLIFQWDSCFMSTFAHYGRDVFPAMPTLDNFYQKQRPDGYIQRVYNESDGQPVAQPTPDENLVNPPLFAWIEWSYYEKSGDDTRLARVLPTLTRYYHWLHDHTRTTEADLPLYHNTPLGSGMDNIPRDQAHRGAYIDASAQMALFALAIKKIAAHLKQPELLERFTTEHQQITQAIRTHLWNPTTHYFHDRSPTGTLSPVKHIGTYWTLLAEVPTPEQQTHLLEHLRNPDEFWRPHLVPALSADDPEYSPDGYYWRGGIWAPTNYMLTAGLTTANQPALARTIAINHLQQLSKVYHHFTPASDKLAHNQRFADDYHTLWECYNPERPTPATRWDNTWYSRQDFVGWTGLGPIAMLIEHILGIRIHPTTHTIDWTLHRDNARHGIRHLAFGEKKCTLIATPTTQGGWEITTHTDTPFTLRLHDHTTTTTHPIEPNTPPIHLPPTPKK